MRRLVFLSVFGHTNIDCLATVPSLPRPDASQAFEGPTRALGGTAANIAVSAGALGVPVSLSSFVGPDFPPAFETLLRRRGVDTRHLVRVPGASTPVCWIFSDPAHRQMAFINQGAAEAGARMPPNPRALRAAIGSARVVHLATGPPLHHLRVAALAHRLRRRVSFDPGQELSYRWTPTLFRRMLASCDTLFLNDAERALARRYLHAPHDRALLRSVGELVLTHGVRGAEYLSHDTHARVPAVRARRTVNTVGAGDAFRGAYYAALFRGLPPLTRLRWGAAAASFAVETSAAAADPPSPSRLARRLAHPP